MKKWISLFITLILCGSLCLHAQTRKELERKRKRAQKEIAYIQKVLRQTDIKKTESINALKTLNKLIEERKGLLQAMNNEIGFLNSSIDRQTQELDTLNMALAQEKSRYSRLVYQSYKAKRSFNTLEFIFSAHSFNDAIRRIRYLRWVRKEQKRALQRIDENKKVVQVSLHQLKKNLIEKDSLKLFQEKEKESLEGNKRSENQMLNRLKGKEKDLKKKLAVQKRASRKLDKAIKAIIAKEIEEARKRREAERKRREAEKKRRAAAEKKGETSTEKLESTPEASVALSAEFKSNQLKLPWPVERGFISERFGKHPHATLKNITIENNGVNITTTKGTSARAVFSGEVSAVINIPGMGTTVLINHGNYYTVYAKLASATVQKGDKVSTKQKLGTVSTDEGGKTELHFEIWFNQVKQNPELWLAKK